MRENNAERNKNYVVISGGYSGKAKLGDIAVVVDHNTNKDTNMLNAQIDKIGERYYP